MKKITKKEILNFIRKLPSTTFKNEFGEEFKIYSSEITVFIKSTETDDQIIPLFNENFSIWSREEMYKLGKAIMELNKNDTK